MYTTFRMYVLCMYVDAPDCHFPPEYTIYTVRRFGATSEALLSGRINIFVDDILLLNELYRVIK